MDGNPKQEVAEKLRSSGSVLVTVSKDPTVDQLAAALGLSLMLTKLGKHTTTVFSGDIPNTMEFLDPERTFDSTVDGLRDFIISLDKDKADKLRYKVEDNVVKIFITPYRSKISEKDLQFSQGDYNVDLVVALGVHKREDLDNAITAHGRILHDAAIVTINAGGKGGGNLGAVDWSDSNASSLSEMLVSISEALEGGILDAQMSTAFLTGIVSVTERFKNEKTTPKVMTMAAQLMAAGANQQLIATNLQLPDTPNDQPQAEPLKEPETQPADAQENKTEQIEHKEDEEDKEPESLEDIEGSVHAHHNRLDENGRTKKLDNEDPAIQKLEEELSQDGDTNLIDLEDRLKSYDPDKPADSSLPPPPPPPPQGDNNSFHIENAGNEEVDKPIMGGTFNATSEQAHDSTEAAIRRDQNRSILQHGNPGESNTMHSHRAADIPTSADLMKDLEDARRAVEMAADQSEPIGSPTQALRAAPMMMEEGSESDMDLHSMPGLTAPPSGPMPPMPPPPIPSGYNQQYGAGSAGGSGPMNSPFPQQQPMQPPNGQFQPPQPQQPQQPMNNQMFTMPPQPNQQYSPNGAIPPMPPMNGNGNGNSNGNGMMPPPPMPPNAPPPMPPFN